MSTALGLESPVDGLYASTPEPLPFAPSLHIRAFLLRRPRGNLLIYSTGRLEADAPAIDDLGGISRQYLNHRHEAMFASAAVGAPLFVHANERRSVETSSHVRATFSKRHMLDEDFEVIPTPGHTSGATAFLWDSGSHRFLFTGDSIYLRDGRVGRRGARLERPRPPTWRASSCCATSTSTCSCPGRRPAAGPTTPSRAGRRPGAGSTRSSKRVRNGEDH